MVCHLAEDAGFSRAPGVDEGEDSSFGLVPYPVRSWCAHAVALNNADAAMLEAADPTAGGNGNEYQAGYEFAGDVTAVGEGVDTIGVGRRVMGTTFASFAQYVLADHRYVLPVPGGLDRTEACALPTGLLTEQGALMTGGFRPGQSVLITGVTSSIGLVGLQFARAPGAGQTFAACLPATAVDGVVVSSGCLDQGAVTIDLDDLSYRNLHVCGVSFGFTRATELGAVIAAAGQDLLLALADGRVRPLIDSTLTFGTADQAVTRLVVAVSWPWSRRAGRSGGIREREDAGVAWESMAMRPS